MPMKVVSTAIGYFAPTCSPWGVGLALMVAQAVVLAVQSQSFGLLPLGMILFGFLGLPVVAMAAVGGYVARRLAG